jgi:hypothetical protein
MSPDNFIFSDIQTFEVKFTLEYCKKSPALAAPVPLVPAGGHYGGIIKPSWPFKSPLIESESSE